MRVVWCLLVASFVPAARAGVTLDCAALVQALAKAPPRAIARDFARAARFLAQQNERLERAVHTIDSPEWPDLQSVRAARGEVAQLLQDPSRLAHLSWDSWFECYFRLGFRREEQARPEPYVPLLDPAGLGPERRRAFRAAAALHVVQELERREWSYAGVLGANRAALLNLDGPDHPQAILNIAAVAYADASLFAWMPDGRPKQFQSALATLVILDTHQDFWTFLNHAKALHLISALTCKDRSCLVAASPAHAGGFPPLMNYQIKELDQQIGPFLRLATTEAVVLREAERLLEFLRERASRVRNLLGAPHFTFLHENALRRVAEELLDPRWLAPLGGSLPEETTIYTSQPLRIRAEQNFLPILFSLNRPSLQAGAVIFSIYDPEYLLIAGEPLTRDQKKQVWLLNFASAIEEYLHFVQFARFFGGLQGTAVNVSEWAGRQEGPTIDFEADVYAHLVELLGPLPSFVKSSYRSRRWVPF